MKTPIDIKHLERYVFGDRALLDEILTIFIKQATTLVERFEASEDDETWRSTAHTLKGASRGVGAWLVGDLAERAEELVGPECAAERQALIGELRRAGQAAVDFARNYRDGSI